MPIGHTGGSGFPGGAAGRCVGGAAAALQRGAPAGAPLPRASAGG
jgi:hypothetical protein